MTADEVHEEVEAVAAATLTIIRELRERVAALEAAKQEPLAWPKIDPDRLADSWIGGV